MPSPDTDKYKPLLDDTQRSTLLRLARESIAYGLAHSRSMPIQVADYPDALKAKRACFVTLHRHGDLRGCIGHLEAIQPLVEDIVSNAYSAAFQDPRFPPLAREELDDLDIHISILTPSEPLQFSSEADLLRQIVPGEDGLILEEGRLHKGTFLPSVWETLPNPHEFLAHLKRKAGLPAGHWSDRIRVSRYRTESFS